MIVVSDTSAITSLIQIGRANILTELFLRVLIPAAVRDELKEFHEVIPEFIEVVSVQGAKEVEELFISLDRGEAEAIVLAKEQSPDFLLIDDLAARTIAIAQGLPVIGLLGVLIKAKRSGLVLSLAKVLEELEIYAGFRISSDLKALVLRAVEE